MNAPTYWLRRVSDRWYVGGREGEVKFVKRHVNALPLPQHKAVEMADAMSKASNTGERYQVVNAKTWAIVYVSE